MNTKIKIKQVKDVVKTTLQTHPETKDSDLRLLKRIWWKEFQDNGCSSFIQFLSMLEEGKFTHPASVIRCRRKLQQHEPELRGTNQKEKNEVQEIVKTDLKSFYDV